MDTQLIIAIVVLIAAVLFLGRSIIGKQLKLMINSGSDQKDGCGPDCKCQ